MILKISQLTKSLLPVLQLTRVLWSNPEIRFEGTMEQTSPLTSTMKPANPNNGPDFTNTGARNEYGESLTPDSLGPTAGGWTDDTVGRQVTFRSRSGTNVLTSAFSA